jgi:hypothetical protein
MIAFPSNPDIGDFHTYAKRTWVWNGNAWQSSNYRPDGAIVADTPPSNPESGWLWWDRINSRLYTWNGIEWVEPNTNFPIGDPDIWNYVLQVEGIDGQPLETGVVSAYGNFITGLKTDGLWDAVKASCILAGARTLDAALIPMTGPTPTNLNFTPADYDRKTGLKGDGGGKYLNSNRSNAADPQNSQHLAIYIMQGAAATSWYMDGGNSATGTSSISKTLNGAWTNRSRNSGNETISSNPVNPLGFVGQSRSDSTGFTFRAGSANISRTRTSQTPSNFNVEVYRRRDNAFYSDARLSFYSIGEAIDLVKLDARVTALMSDLNAAIV